MSRPVEFFSPTRPLPPDNASPGRSLQVADSQPLACVCVRVCVHARAHTHTHTYTACPPERRRTGASTQTLLALGCTRVEWKDSGEENSDATQRSPEKWVSGRPPWEGKEKGLGKEKKRARIPCQGTRARAWKPGAARRGSTRRELGFLPLGPGGRRPRERKRPALSPARCPFVTATRPSPAPTPTPRG